MWVQPTIYKHVNPGSSFCLEFQISSNLVQVCFLYTMALMTRDQSGSIVLIQCLWLWKMWQCLCWGSSVRCAVISGCHRSGYLGTDPKMLRLLWRFYENALGSKGGIGRQRPYTTPQGTLEPGHPLEMVHIKVRDRDLVPPH